MTLDLWYWSKLFNQSGPSIKKSLLSPHRPRCKTAHSDDWLQETAPQSLGSITEVKYRTYLCNTKLSDVSEDWPHWPHEGTSSNDADIICNDYK